MTYAYLKMSSYFSFFWVTKTEKKESKTEKNEARRVLERWEFECRKLIWEGLDS